MLQTRSGDSMQEQQVFVYVPGSRWENVQGTDHRLAAALARHVPVLWVDPPLPVHLAFRRGRTLLRDRCELDNVAPDIIRLRSLSVPGFTRPVLSLAANYILGGAIKAALRALAVTPVAVMVSSPISGFPTRMASPRVLFVTDDWVSGAPMMGLSGPLVHRTLRRNLRNADLAAAVSPYLAECLKVNFPSHLGAVVLPNGCDVRKEPQLRVERSGTAALLGQLNERLDISLLEAVKDAGIPVVVIGPRTDRDAETGRRLDTFLASENVTWLGEIPAQEVGRHLASVGVGLTPYADNAFNRASFPLKTLDYLAAGVPVVATDLPAVRWLNTELVTVGNGPEEFLRRVQQALARPDDPAADERRRHFAGRHTWEARATQLLELIGVHTSGQEA